MRTTNGDIYFGSKGWWTFSGIATVVASGDAGYPAHDPAGNSSDPCSGRTSRPLQRVPRCALRHHRGRRHLAGAGVGRRVGSASPPGRAPARAATPTPTTPEAAVAGQHPVRRPRLQRHLRRCRPEHRDPDLRLLAAAKDHRAGRMGTSPAGPAPSAPLVAAYYALIESSPGIGCRRRRSRARSGHTTISATLGSTTSPPAPTGSCPALSFVCNAASRLRRPDGRGEHLGRGSRGRARDRRPRPRRHYTQSVTATTAQLQGGVYPNGEPDDVLVGVRHHHRLRPGHGPLPGRRRHRPVRGRGRADRPRAEHHLPLPPGGAESAGYGADVRLRLHVHHGGSAQHDGQRRRRRHPAASQRRRLDDSAAAPSRAAARPLTRTRSPGPSPPRSASRGSPRSAAHRPR